MNQERISKEKLRGDISKLFSEMVGELDPRTGQPKLKTTVETKLVDEMLPDDPGFFRPTPEEFNRLLLYHDLDIASKSFFYYFFPRLDNFEDFKTGIKRIRKTSMLLYGNFKYGFIGLGKKDNVREVVEGYIKVKGEYPRSELNPVPKKGEKIDREYLPLLCYRLEKEGKWPDSLGGASSALTEDEKTKIREETKDKGKINAHRYLGLEDIDVYIATSMDEEEDVIETAKFIDELFEDKVKNLRLWYFNPLQAYLDDSRQKGLMESLLLKRAKAMVCYIGSKITFGKVSELATMLVQGKPVIAYVPRGNAEYEDRYKELTEIHPLGLQTELRTGVANGIVVARSTEQCAEVLRDIFELSTRDFRRYIDEQLEIDEDSGNYLLREKRTGSIIRIVTKDPFLTNAFWTYYLREEQ